MPAIPFGPFRPDEADGNPGVLADLANVSLKPGGYGPLPALVVPSTATALPAAPKGSLTCVTSAGVYKQFVMTASKIYLMSASGVPTELGSGYALPAGDRWGATQFGKYAYFSNTADGQLRYDIEAGGSITAVSGAPKARVLRTVFNVIFALDCDGENRVMRNSDFDGETWTPGTGVAQYQVFADGDELLGIEEIADGVAVVLQRRAIRTLTRTPDQTLYTANLVARNKGAVNPQCIVPVNGAVYYIDTNGPHRFSGAGVERIGLGKVEQWLTARLGTGGSGIEGAFDPGREVIRWRYPSSSSETTTFTKGLDFDPGFNEFVPVEASTSALFTTATPGYTLEDMDAFGTLDELTLSLDDRFWFGGTPGLAGLDASYKAGYFTGAALAARLETATAHSPNSIAVNRATPLSDASSITLAVGQSDKLSDALTYTTAASPETSDGSIALSARGRNLTYKVAIAAGDDWTYFRGLVDVEAVPGGV